MSHTLAPVVTLTGVSFAWPDGTPALHDITATFNAGRTGLIGDNGSGKTTLLRLIAAELMPASGSVVTAGRVGRLSQRLTLATAATVADLLGIRAQWEALRAIESGDADPAHFDTLGDAWDVESRGRAALARTGLPDLGLDRRMTTLSGGEAMLVALAGLLLAGDEIVLLDEPTNNLDRSSRWQLYDAIAGWPGTLIVVSHDVELLNLMDETAELHDGRLTVFGGPFDDYREYLAREQAAAEQALRTAEQTLRTERRQRVAAQTTLARRQRYARTDFENKRKPKIIMNQRKTEAQVSAGKLRGELDARVEAARV
ncbi:MAG: ABC-F family ATP-binding cassette domain-containing protein, partial [Micropruina sp.]|nr:ABC-F family ATP-binding cassette domain-containing protein [Micropruina sp.]